MNSWCCTSTASLVKDSFCLTFEISTPWVPIFTKKLAVYWVLSLSNSIAHKSTSTVSVKIDGLQSHYHQSVKQVDIVWRNNVHPSRGITRLLYSLFECLRASTTRAPLCLAQSKAKVEMKNRDVFGLPLLSVCSHTWDKHLCRWTVCIDFTKRQILKHSFWELTLKGLWPRWPTLCYDTIWCVFLPSLSNTYQIIKKHLYVGAWLISGLIMLTSHISSFPTQCTPPPTPQPPNPHPTAASLHPCMLTFF